MHEGIEHLVALGIVIFMVGYSISGIASFRHYSALQTMEGDVWLASSTLRSIVLQLSDRSGEIDADKLARLSEVYYNNIAYGADYLPYQNFTYQLGLRNVDFHLQVSYPLKVSYEFMESNVIIKVSKTNGAPAQASVKIYSFNGHEVKSEYGETSAFGQVIFPFQIMSGDCLIIFARSGNAVGVNSTMAGGAQLPEMLGYVKEGKLHNAPPSYYIFSYEDWVGPISDGSIALGYSLPYVIIQKDGAIYRQLVYPHVPKSYGPPPSQFASSITKLITIKSYVFVIKIECWGVAEL